MHHIHPPYRLLLLCTSCVLIVVCVVALLDQRGQSAQLIPVQEGQCSGVPIEPVSGKPLVYCCLDEFALLEEEGYITEANAFLQALRATQTMSAEDVDAFYEGAYTSPIHTKYGLKTACGEMIDCQLCTPDYRDPAVENYRDPIPVCGNGTVEGNETCDAGVANSDAPDAPCRRDCTAQRCGDGIPDSGEECDDGNGVSGDGCSQRCTVEPVLSTSICGNGIPEEGEQCDDGNTVSGDGCSDRCTEEVQEPICGNGIKEEGEQCEPILHDPSLGFSCDNDCRFVSPECGNSIVDPGEECDAGVSNADTPDALCRTDCSNRRCGDGIPDFDHREECDDGNRNNDDACSNDCTKQSVGAAQQNRNTPSQSTQTASVTGSTRVHVPKTSNSGPEVILFIAGGAAIGWAATRKKKQS